MMISSSSATDPYAAAAALDRALRSNRGPGADGGPPGDASPLQSGPDVVVSLSQGASAPPATYDASGRMGANAPDSTAHASESDDDTDAPDATGSTSAPAANADADATATSDQDAAVPA